MNFTTNSEIQIRKSYFFVDVQKWSLGLCKYEYLVIITV